MPRAPGFFATASKIAWREALASRGKFFFVVLAVAAGVGALTGVRGFARSFRTMLLEDARTLMAADFSARMFELPDQSQTGRLAALAERGVRNTRITETLSMMFSPAAAAPALVFVKAVDPAAYPYYGEVKLDPPRSLRETLDDSSVAVSEDLLLRLGLRTGDTVKLGSAEVRIAAVVKLEPDRMTGSLNVGPRVMISRAALERTEIIRPGSRASQRFLFAMAPGGSAAELRREIAGIFPRALISDYRETHPQITRGLDRSERFLSLVSLIALVVAAIGVAMALRAHLEQRMESIAMMKCLGARSGQILRIYLLQTLGIGAAGGALGVAVGAVVQAVFPKLIARVFPVPPRSFWSWEAAAEGLGVGVLVAMLFTLPPLLAVRRVRPAAIFRRDVASGSAGWGFRLRQWAASAAVAVILVAGVALVAFYLADGFDPGRSRDQAVRTSAFFAGGLAAGLAILGAASWVLLRALRLLVGRRFRALPSVVRHGLANVYRPGNQAPATLVALGAGVMFTLTVYLLQHGLIAQMAATAPRGMPNVFLINVTASEYGGLMEMMDRDPARSAPPELIPMVNARILSIDGKPFEPNRRRGSNQQVTWRADKPESAQVVAGAWWSGRPPAPQVCVEEDEARDYGVKPGAAMEFGFGGRRLAARVACVWRRHEFRFGGNMDFVFSPGALDGLPATFMGGAHLKRPGVAAFQKAVFDRFPTVTVIDVAEIMDIAQGVVDQVALVVRFVALFAILAGAIILGASVAGTRMRRVREVAILKTVGATRRRVAAIFSMEFLVIGTAAGLIGAGLASGFADVLLPRLMNVPSRFEPLPAAVTVVLAAVLANVAGWLASWRILGLRPLEVLRGE